MKKFDIKSDNFRRAVRFTHKFEGLTQDNPWGTPTWQMEAPIRPNERRSAQAHVQTHGEYSYPERKSPVCKPGGGYASINGPHPDIADDIASPVPQSTSKRLNGGVAKDKG